MWGRREKGNRMRRNTREEMREEREEESVRKERGSDRVGIKKKERKEGGRKK